MKSRLEIVNLKELVENKINNLTTEFNFIKNPTMDQKYDFNIEATKLMAQHDILLEVLK